MTFDNPECTPHAGLQLPLHAAQGTAGAPGLGSAELAAALSSRELFVYCGHGGGQQHIQRRSLQRLPRCAAALLMGCSSGRLAAPAGNAPSLGRSPPEPTGPVLAYLIAGALHACSMLLLCQ